MVCAIGLWLRDCVGGGVRRVLAAAAAAAATAAAAAADITGVKELNGLKEPCVLSPRGVFCTFKQLHLRLFLPLLSVRRLFVMKEDGGFVRLSTPPRTPTF